MQSINQFLAEVEKRAYHMAYFATGCQQDALDLVQETMLSLVQSYEDRPASEWKPLFFRILQNKIRDHHRRKTLTGKLFSWLNLHQDDETSETDHNSHMGDSRTDRLEMRLELDRFSQDLICAVEALPLRQQQAFLLRTWEGFSVKETAEVMQCSEGSIKTHLSRALTALRNELAAYESAGLTS